MTGQGVNEFTGVVTSIRDAFYLLLDLEAWGYAEEILFALAGVDEQAWNAVNDVEWDDTQRRR